jgi:protoheme IX farnesyltransferase
MNFVWRGVGSVAPMVTESASSRTSLRRTAAAFVALTKPRIIELLLVTTVPAMVVAKRGVPSPWLVVATVVGGTLAAGGANALNMVLDRDIDAIMKRTQKRPLVTGELTATQATVFALILEVAAFVELDRTANLLSAVLAISATAFYVGVYTAWLKRRSSQNIVIGGAAGAAPVLIGWAAVTGSLTWAPVVLFVIVFLWTPPHFWALAVRYRDDYEAAKVPMLPVVRSLRRTTLEILVYTIALWAATALFGSVASMGPIYAVGSFLLGAGFTYLAARLYVDARVDRADAARAMRLFGFSITYLTALFVLMAVDVLVRHH